MKTPTAKTPRPISMTIAALGGQGGGVVSDWLVQVAGLEQHLVQATSVPGVAQRTGATIYYLEFFPKSALPADGREPVMALMPTPGDVDLVVASELLEAGRSLARGIVTVDRTTVITSTHRDYAISEKASRHDARADSAAVLGDVAAASRRLMTLDMRAIADASGGHLSAVMLGAIAGSGVLPFARESYLTAIKSSGFNAARGSAAFDAAYAAVNSPVSTAARNAASTHAAPALRPLPPRLAERLATEISLEQRGLVEQALRRLLDYQDERYASQYLDRLQLLPVHAAGNGLRAACARALAVWMSFEDVIRVADLKTRLARVARVARAAGSQSGELVGIVEFVKPRVEEILGTLPAGMARVVGRSARLRRWLTRLCGGRQVSTSTISGFLLLRCVALLRPWRRSTLRFLEEDRAISAWLELVRGVAANNEGLAQEIVACQQLVRGYGETRERGVAAFDAIMRIAARADVTTATAGQIRALREAAMSDDEGTALQRLLQPLAA
jgi:indolepyruvate ferredoxin oxidoreductase beta subunit